MIIKKPIFSVPIYLCSQSEFYKRLEQMKKRGEEKYKKTYAFMRLSIPYDYQPEKTQWKYDKIIGWIEFYLNGKTIKADYWFITAQRIQINIKTKQFEYRHKINDVSETHNKSNKEIIKDIKTFLSNCQEGRYVNLFTKYYIDTSELYELLKFIDFKAMINSTNHEEIA